MVMKIYKESNKVKKIKNIFLLFLISMFVFSSCNKLENDAVEKQDNPKITLCTIDVATVCNVRKGPGINYPVLTSFRQNDQAEILSYNSEHSWAFVKKDQIRGWVNTKYVKLIPNEDKRPAQPISQLLEERNQPIASFIFLTLESLIDKTEEWDSYLTLGFSLALGIIITLLVRYVPKQNLLSNILMFLFFFFEIKICIFDLIRIIPSYKDDMRLVIWVLIWCVLAAIIHCYNTYYILSRSIDSIFINSRQFFKRHLIVTAITILLITIVLYHHHSYLDYSIIVFFATQFIFLIYLLSKVKVFSKFLTVLQYFISFIFFIVPFCYFTYSIFKFCISLIVALLLLRVAIPTVLKSRY